MPFALSTGTAAGAFKKSMSALPAPALLAAVPHGCEAHYQRRRVLYRATGRINWARPERLLTLLVQWPFAQCRYFSLR
jgi:hypothetical protein